MSRRYLFFSLATASILMSAIDFNIIAVALPTMAPELGTTLTWVGWTVTAYMLTYTAMISVAGKLSQMLGNNRVFFGCILVFTVGSLLCAIAPNIYFLIVARVFQAAGGSGLMPAAVALIVKDFPDKRDRMVGLITTVTPLGGIIGPNLGGIIVANYSWREIFVINLPLGALILAGLFSRLREPEQTKSARIDYPGVALFTSSIVSIMLALSFLGNDPRFVREPQFWLLILGGGVLLVLFGRHEGRVPDPLIDPKIVFRAPFLVINMFNFLLGCAVFGVYTFVPYYAVEVLHLTTLQSGSTLTVRSLAMIGTGALASFVLLRIGYRLPMVIGLVFIASTGFLLSTGSDQWIVGSVHISAFWVLSLEVAISGLGMGLVSPTSNNAALDLLPEQAASITAMRSTFRFLGGILTTTLIVLVLELSPSKAAGLLQVYFAVGIIVACAVPLAFLIPDGARARYKERRLALATEVAGST